MKAKSKKVLSEQKMTDDEQQLKLVEAFLSCPQFRVKDIRDAVCSSLPSDIQAKIRRSDIDKVDASNIITTCWQYQYPDSIDYLLEALFNFEGNSNAWKNLSNVWLRIHPPKYPELSPQNIKPVVADTYSSVGEHICIDRRWECTTFEHMRARDGHIPQRILAFQVPGGKGKSLLLKRFNYVCQIDASKNGKKILHARIDFRDRCLTPYLLIVQLLTEMLDNAEMVEPKLPDMPEKQLKELYQKVQQLGKEKDQKATSETELLELAREIFVALRRIPNEWTIVWILDTFEDAGEAGDWLISYFIPKIVEMDNVILVLAGRKGLSNLENRFDEVIFRSSLTPMKYRDDCQRWAELKYGLKISEEAAKRIIQQYSGNLQQIDMVLNVIKDFPDLPELIATMGG